MKKAAVIMAVLALLVLSQMCYAVDLQQGWYVKLSGVGLFGYNWQTGQQEGTSWNFTGSLGNQGPFSITSPDPVWAERMVSIPISVNNVAPGTSVYLWGSPKYSMGCSVDQVSFFWETNYQSARMQIQLLMYKQDAGFTTLWSQTKSGLNSDFGNVLSEFQYIPVGYVPVFRVVAVPEPSSILAVSGLFSGLFIYRRRAC